MRISDWSSDVCSSDLYHPVRLPWAPAPKRLGDTQVDIPASARCDAELPHPGQFCQCGCDGAPKNVLPYPRMGQHLAPFQRRFRFSSCNVAVSFFLSPFFSCLFRFRFLCSVSSSFLFSPFLSFFLFLLSFFSFFFFLFFF